jgi:hypothetical protein
MSDSSDFDPAYRTLSAANIIATIGKLSARIDERFPGAGLGRVCRQLGEVASESEVRVGLIRRRNLSLRLGVVVVIAASVWLLAQILPLLDLGRTSADSVYTLLQGVEAAMNILVLIGATLLFLFTAEERMKRRRALTALHELRSIAHVIDMHQLTKDPSATLRELAPTRHSPARSMTPAELVRYLDYCSEMLSLVAKVAALYAQSLPDSVVTEAVSDIERTTANMSQKIWQKIMIVEADRGQHAAAGHVAAGSAQADTAVRPPATPAPSSNLGPMPGAPPRSP